MIRLAGLKEIYNLKDAHAKGRLISLADGLIAAIYNVFITGVFYTGFLSMYGMSITNVGIITFIPLIASCFCVFSSSVLKHFPRRKPVLIAAKIFFYSMYILATTLMPNFVTDSTARLIWFAVILFVAHAVYALFSPGFPSWFYTFYPPDNERRTRYILLNHVFSSIMQSIILVCSGLLTDALAGSPRQNTLILFFRYLSFVLVLIDVSFQACAKEEPHENETKVRLSEVFTIPFRHRKFLRCMLVMFTWNFLCNTNSGLWNYHLLNHMHFSYTLLNTVTMMYTVILLLANRFWQKVLRRYSWIKTFGITNILWAPTEILFFMMTTDRGWMYFPLCMIQNFLNVGVNLAYANVLYINMPEENSTSCIAFSSIGCNLSAFIGLTIGTKISSIGGDVPILFLGMEIYTVQFVTLIRAACLLGMGLVLTFHWRRFTPERDIQDLEASEAFYKQMRERRKQKHQRFLKQEGRS